MNVTFAVIFKKCFRNCKNDIFFSPRKDMDYQPIAWRVLFKQPKYYIDFRWEITKTVKIDKLCH